LRQARFVTSQQSVAGARTFADDRNFQDMSSQTRQPKLHRIYAAHPELLRQPSDATIPDRQTVTDAYIYLLGRALIIRQERTDLREPGFTYNAIRANPLGAANTVNPNLDVACLEAWVAVDDRRCVVLEIPEIEHRYYTVQLVDEWGEVIANINERTFPSKPFGSFALVEPGATPRLPDGAGRIELHSSKAKLLARIELKDDPAGALRLQKRFRLTALGMPEIARPPAVPIFDNDKLLGVEIFDEIDIMFASALDVSPNASELQQMVRAVGAYANSTVVARQEIHAEIRQHVIPAFRNYVTANSQPYRGHWFGGGQTGHYGADFRQRTTANYASIWANTTDEVIYFGATRDANEAPLEGAHSYVMRFDRDHLPESVVEGYWSVMLVSVPEYRIVPNSLNRHNFNSYTPLAFEPDGALTIAVGPQPVPGVAESNWLPTDAAKAFALTFRAYVPKVEVKSGRWIPPALTRVA
jgi:hypothetical protein